MIERTYFVGQQPVSPLVIKVVDERKLTRSLTAYTAAQVLIVSPDGWVTYEGSAQIADPAGGLVTHSFTSSPFLSRGDYRLQLKLTGPTGVDFTDILTLRVLASLEDA